jgi:ubiquinone/menaquinone biosynthesis C-methylase UbiE
MHRKKAEKILQQVNETYEEIAEEFSNTRNYYGEEFKMFLPYIKKNSRIADLGCGNGRVAGFLNDNFPAPFSYTGIDNSKKFLSISKKRYPNHKFIHGDLLKLPLETNSIDFAVCVRAFHHIPSKAYRLNSLKEIHRILKKDGILFLSVWNLNKKKYLLNHIASYIRWIFTLGSYEKNDLIIKWGNNNKRYYHAFTAKELHNLLIQSGFSIIKTTESNDLIFIVKKNGI